MKPYLLLAPLALLAVPMATAAPASADEVTIRTHSDRGFHRGWHHEPRDHARKVVIRRHRDIGATGSTRTVKKVTKTNEFGDRVTKKVIKDSDD